MIDPRRAASRCIVLVAICSGVALIAACGSSAPTRYHTLMASDVMSSTTDARSAIVIQLLPVDIPAQVDRSEMVLRRNTAEVLLAEHERWIAPLADEIRTALSVDLARELRREGAAERTSAQSLVRVKVRVQRFESVPDQYVALDAQWEFHSSDGASAFGCSAELRESIGPGYDEIVRGHQQLLSVLSTRIAASVSLVAIGKTESCTAHS